MADRVHIDYETFSELDLPSVGVGRYSRHSSTEALMAAWSLNDVKQKQWIPAEGENLPPDLKEALEDPHVIKWAWNAPFEINITRNTLGIDTPLESWRDTMVLALTCSLPGKLEKAGPVVDLEEDKLKDTRGRRLMSKFSSPRKPTKTKPQTRVYWYEAYSDWLEYLAYNDRDEDSERAIYHRLKAYMPPDDEWELWHLDQKINEAGIPINMRMVRNAISIYEATLRTKLDEMQEITGLDNANSGPQLLPWLQDNGYPFQDLKKGHITRAIERRREELGIGEGSEAIGHNGGPALDDDDALLRVLELRSEVSRTSPKKYHALRRAVDPQEWVLRYAFQFAGAARTWRWGGRLFQPQNLPRPIKKLEKKLPVHAKNVEILDSGSFNLLYDKPMDVLASTIRPAAQAPDGFLFIDADLNAIENRVLGWLAGCEKILRVFRLGRDPYVDFATYLFGLPYDVLFAEYKGGDSTKRTISKPGVLGCGYMLGPGEERYNHHTGEKEATGLLGYAWNMQITEFTQEQSKLSVDTFRREFEEVKDYWYGIERAAKKCIRTGRRIDYGHVYFDRKGPFMRMGLPSGRHLHYCRPRIEDVKAPWGEIKPTITYESLNDKKQWVRETTHPGKLTENADQAISRDLLAHGMRLSARRGLDLRIHVHDQLVGLVPEDEAEAKLKILIECMEEQPRWAKGLPLGSNGFISKVFMKD
jgi:DNA polymerase